MGPVQREDWGQRRWARAATLCLAQHFSYMSSSLPSCLGLLVLTTDFQSHTPNHVELDPQHYQHPSMLEENGPRTHLHVRMTWFLINLKRQILSNSPFFLQTRIRETSDVIRTEGREAELHMRDISGILGVVSIQPPPTASRNTVFTATCLHWATSYHS